MEVVGLAGSWIAAPEELARIVRTARTSEITRFYRAGVREFLSEVWGGTSRLRW